MKIKELVDNYGKELIMEIAIGCRGIGPSKAGAIAEEFDSYDEFRKATEKDFREIKTRKENRILNDEQVKEVIAAKGIIPEGLGVRETWLFKLSYDFIHSQVEMLLNLDLDNIDINPLLMEALDLDEPKEILSFTVYQTVTRSVVTAWGTCVEKMVKYVGCEDNDSKIKALKGKNFDLKKCLGKDEYYVQIKSGPNTMNVGMVESLNETIAKLPAGKKAFLGMTYGTRDRISVQIMGNLKDPDTQTKVGRELWDFVAEEKGYYKKVIDVVSDSTKGILSESFIDMMHKRIDTLVQQWKKKYKGMSHKQILEHYI